jgi:hypothetical protein
MSKMLDLLKGATGEAALPSRLGRWRLGISALVDSLQAQLTGLTFSQPYLTQTAWAVDSVTGNDNAAGTLAAPLLTLAELARRWNGRTFAPTVTSVSVSLAGTFVGEMLDLQAQFTAPNLDVPVTVSGTMVAAGLSGAITTYQAFVVGATRASVTVGGADFSTLKQKRIRITSGAVNGAVSTICSTGAGVTVANVGQFSTVTGLTGTNANPANGDGFIVESFQTQIRQYNVNCPGAVVTVRDLSIQAPAGGTSNNQSQQATNFLLKIFGCEFSTGTGIVTNVEGDAVFVSCSVIGASQVQTVNCFQSWKNSVVLSTSPIAHSLGSAIQATSMIHDGDGVRNSGLNITNNSQVVDTTQRAFFGCVNGGGLTCMARCGGGGAQWSLANFWGATGNTTTNAAQVVNGSMAQYTTLPSATGATPGVNDVVIGGAGMAWGGLPFANAAPDNASFNVRH